METNRVDSNTAEESNEVTDFAAVSSNYLHSYIPKEYFYDFTGKRGLLVILNHYKYIPHKFRKPPPTRDGTGYDLKRLQHTFEKLNFSVEPHTDLTYNEIMNVMQGVAKRDHSSTSCVAVCVMTHGEEGGKLLATDREYSSRDLFTCLAGDSCPQLLRAPKLFFIQACRGEDYDDGVEVDSQTTNSIKLPSTANFLIMYSTVEGGYTELGPRKRWWSSLLCCTGCNNNDFVSWRNGDGSWFVQALCNEIEGRYEYMDLLHILTFVNWHIAYCKTSNTGVLETHNKKQMPQIVSTLTKLVKFTKTEIQ